MASGRRFGADAAALAAQVHVQLQGDAGRTDPVVLPAGPKAFTKGATATFDFEHLPYVGHLQVC